MILYDFICAERHRFSGSLKSMFDANPDCPACGTSASRVPASPRLMNRADPGPSRDQMPRSWKAIRGGDPETVAHWRTTIAAREKLEEKYPELAGDRRPVLAHEGIFANAPLRAGDDVASAVQQALTSSSASGNTHTHTHTPRHTTAHKEDA